jgi:two-component system CheB/CheR fusion protein
VQTERPLRDLRILLVEDSHNVRDAFTMLLRADGATVVAVGSGRAALARVATDSFDVVLSDYGLPDMRGDDLVRAVRACSKPGTRTLVVTGYGEPHVTRARRAGAEVVFTKPVEWREVVSWLASSPKAA